MVNLQKSKDLGWGLNHPWFEAVEAEAAEGFDDVIEQTRQPPSVVDEGADKRSRDGRTAAAVAKAAEAVFQGTSSIQ